jgi:hypothetical protein
MGIIFDWSPKWLVLREKHIKNKKKRIGFSNLLDIMIFTFPRLRLKKLECRLYIPP